MRTIAQFIVGVVAGVVLLAGVQALTQPHCPTEDSCRPMYEDGRWVIAEVTP